MGGSGFCDMERRVGSCLLLKQSSAGCLCGKGAVTSATDRRLGAIETPGYMSASVRRRAQGEATQNRAYGSRNQELQGRRACVSGGSYPVRMRWRWKVRIQPRGEDP